MQEEQQISVIKLIIVGHEKVGKSSLMLRYCDNEFTEQYLATIGVDFKIKALEVNGRQVKLQIWDTAGQERFQSITTAYYRGASGMMIVYDVTSRDSFEKAKDIFNKSREYTTQDVVYAVVGNKSDLNGVREISFEEGMSFANEIGAYFQETSAKENYSIDIAFHDLALRCVQKL
eukprot:403367106